MDKPSVPPTPDTDVELCKLLGKRLAETALAAGREYNTEDLERTTATIEAFLSNVRNAARQTAFTGAIAEGVPQELLVSLLIREILPSQLAKSICVTANTRLKPSDLARKPGLCTTVLENPSLAGEVFDLTPEGRELLAEKGVVPNEKIAQLLAPALAYETGEYPIILGGITSGLSSDLRARMLIFDIFGQLAHKMAFAATEAGTKSSSNDAKEDPLRNLYDDLLILIAASPLSAYGPAPVPFSFRTFYVAISTEEQQKKSPTPTKTAPRDAVISSLPSPLQQNIGLIVFFVWLDGVRKKLVNHLQFS